MKKKNLAAHVVAIALLLLTGLNAVFAGYLLISDPTGKGMDMTTDILKHSPFSSFLIPGMILFWVLGISNIIVAVLTVKKQGNYALLVIAEGAVLLGWLLVQMFLLQTANGLHLIMGIIAVALILAGFVIKKNETTVGQ